MTGYRTVVNKASDVPNGEHYAILEFDTIYIPGDDRSRSNPVTTGNTATKKQ